jgi:hypothetical protein
MRKFGVLAVAALALAMFSLNAMAQRGGAVRGGVRGAAVGEMVGGESAAKAGAVIGATRGAAQRTAMVAETQARTQYQTTAAYQNAQRSNFNQAPPEVVPTSPTAAPAAAGTEAVIKKDGKPVVGVTYPSDWKQKVGEHSVAAVSADGQAFAVIATLEGIKDKQAGIEKMKQGLQKSLKDVTYDEAIKTTEKGTLMVTGSGKGMKSGVDVVFAAGVLDAGAGQFAGAAFVVDGNVDEHYKETVRYICQTIRLAKDFAK